MKIGLFITAVSALVSSPTFAAPTTEYRCGWLDNPTPANYIFTDKTGTYNLEVMGGSEPPGFETMPKLDQREFVRTNHDYGYACVCLNIAIDKKTENVLLIAGGKQRLLKACLEDHALPKPY